jgi:hypothetical protein
MKTINATKKITVTINRRNLRGLINRESFNSSGMFVPYQFIAMDFSEERDNTATFYHSVQPSSNSWINWSGEKIWESTEERNKKPKVLEDSEQGVKYAVKRLTVLFPDVEFKLVGFDN